jgi:hypothetical protein
VRLSLDDLQREAAAAGFRTEPLEKVLRLLETLEALRSHPFLKERIVLKGGTALNLFIFEVPRLSVDIDLNYIGSADRGTMLELWTKKLVEECRGFMAGLLPFKPPEIEFLMFLNDQGEIAPELLTTDAGMQEALRKHPGLLWKAQNVRQYKKGK